MRSWRVLAGLLLGTALLAQPTASERLDRLLKDLLFIDTHVDTAGYVVDEGYQMAEEHHYYEADIPRLRRGHAGAIFFGIYVAQDSSLPTACPCCGIITVWASAT